MSRTKRAKTVNMPRHYFYTREEFERAKHCAVSLRWCNRIQMWRTYEEYVRFEQAYSHSDSGRRAYYEGVPKCARKPRNEKFRRSFNQGLRSAVRHGEEESFLTPVDFKDAGWYYW